MAFANKKATMIIEIFPYTRVYSHRRINGARRFENSIRHTNNTN